MDSRQKEEKIKRFLSDTLMEESVLEVLRDSFLRKRPQSDVQMLAASRLALDFLEDGWKDLHKFKGESGTQKKELAQVGL